MQQNLIRILLSALWAIVWTLMIVLIYMLSLSIFWIWPSEQFSKITLIFIIFVWSIVANSLSTLFVSLSNTEKYNKMEHSMLHIFLFNLILFVLSLIFYLSTSQIQEVALVHIILSIMWSNIILESFWKWGLFILSWIYWTILWSFLLSIILIQSTRLLDNYSLLIFLLLPFSHILISSSIVFMEFVIKKIEKTTKKRIF